MPWPKAFQDVEARTETAAVSSYTNATERLYLLNLQLTPNGGVLFAAWT